MAPLVSYYIDMRESDVKLRLF